MMYDTEMVIDVAITLQVMVFMILLLFILTIFSPILYQQLFRPQEYHIYNYTTTLLMYDKEYKRMITVLPSHSLEQSVSHISG
jgi:hypothetical protein